MVQKNIVSHPKSQVEVQIAVPWADMQAAWDQTLQRMAQEVELPGFRKGQAPTPMVEQQMGAKVQEEVFKLVMPQALVEALQGTEIVPIDYPQYQLVSFVKGQQLAFRAIVTKRPEVKVGNYKVISVKRPELPTVNDADIEKLVMDLFNRWKARNPATPAPGDPATAQATSASPDNAFAVAVGAQPMADLRAKIKQDLEAEKQYNNELDY